MKIEKIDMNDNVNVYIQAKKLNEVIDFLNGMFQFEKKEEPTQEFTQQELKWLQCFTEDSLERYKDNFVTNGSREQWKVLLSKIERLLK